MQVCHAFADLRVQVRLLVLRIGDAGVTATKGVIATIYILRFYKDLIPISLGFDKEITTS